MDVDYRMGKNKAVQRLSFLFLNRAPTLVEKGVLVPVRNCH
jgi:hypothetical protein